MDIYAQSMPPCDKSSNQIDRRSICKLKLKQIKLEGKHDLAPLTASSIQFSYFSKLRAIDFLCPGPHIKPMLQGHKKKPIKMAIATKLSWLFNLSPFLHGTPDVSNLSNHIKGQNVQVACLVMLRSQRESPEELCFIKKRWRFCLYLPVRVLLQTLACQHPSQGSDSKSPGKQQKVFRDSGVLVSHW